MLTEKNKVTTTFVATITAFKINGDFHMQLCPVPISIVLFCGDWKRAVHIVPGGQRPADPTLLTTLTLCMHSVSVQQLNVVS